MKLTENILKNLIEQALTEKMDDSERTDHINAIVKSLKSSADKYEIEDAVKQYCVKNKLSAEDKQRILKNVKAKMKQKENK